MLLLLFGIAGLIALVMIVIVVVVFTTRQAYVPPPGMFEPPPTTKGNVPSAPPLPVERAISVDGRCGPAHNNTKCGPGYCCNSSARCSLEVGDEMKNRCAESQNSYYHGDPSARYY